MESNLRKGQTNEDSILLVEPSTEIAKYVTDAYAYNDIPKEKVSYVKKWDWKPKGVNNTLKLGNISVLDKIRNLKWRDGAMMDSEIHIMFLPHVPINIFRTTNVTVTLYFDGALDEEQREMSRAEFPLPLHTHVIFFPGHSFSLKPGSMYPWSIRVSTDAEISDNYIIADIYVQYKAYNTPTSQYSTKNGVNIISLIPLDEIPTGVALSRPRVGDNWKVHGIKYGVKTKKSTLVLQRLQSARIDIEALKNIGVLNQAITATKKVLHGSESLAANTVDNMIQRAVLSIVTSIKNK